MKIQQSAAFLAALLLLTLTASCLRDPQAGDPQREQFLLFTEYGLYQDGQAVLAFDKKLHQIGFDSEGRYFNIQTPSQDVSVGIRFSTNPAVTETTDVTLTAAGIGDTAGFEGRYQVIHTDAGHIWLWHTEGSKGIIIKNTKHN